VPFDTARCTYSGRTENCIEQETKIMTEDAIEPAAEHETQALATDEPDDGVVNEATDAAPDPAPSDHPGAGDPLEAMRRIDPAETERLRQEWGAAFDANLQRARSAAAAVADDALIAALEETGLGNDPRILRAAARIGALLETGRASSPKVTESKRDSLEAELDRLTAGPDYWSDRVQRRVRQIFLALHGDAPLPVHRAAGDAGGLR
jgi:hypothetical protein